MMDAVELVDIQNVALHSNLNASTSPMSISSAANLNSSGNKDSGSLPLSPTKRSLRASNGGLGRRRESTSDSSKASPRQRTIRINEDVLERSFVFETPRRKRIPLDDRLWSSYNAIYESGDDEEYDDYYYPAARSTFACDGTTSNDVLHVDEMTVRSCNRTTQAQSENSLSPLGRKGGTATLPQNFSHDNRPCSLPFTPPFVDDATSPPASRRARANDATTKQSRRPSFPPGTNARDRSRGVAADPFRSPPRTTILYQQPACRKILKTSFGKYFPTSQSCPNSPVAKKTVRFGTKRVVFADDLCEQHRIDPETKIKADSPAKVPNRTISPPPLVFSSSASSEDSTPIDRWISNAKESLMKMPTSSAFQISDDNGLSRITPDSSPATVLHFGPMSLPARRKSIGDKSVDSMPSLEDIGSDSEDLDASVAADEENPSKDPIAHPTRSRKVANRHSTRKGDVSAYRRKRDEEIGALREQTHKSLGNSLIEPHTLEMPLNRSQEAVAPTELQHQTLEERSRTPVISTMCGRGDNGDKSETKVSASDEMDIFKARGSLDKNEIESQQTAGELSREAAASIECNLLPSLSSLATLKAGSHATTTPPNLERDEVKRKDSCCSNASTLNLTPWKPPIPTLTGQESISCCTVPLDIITAIARNSVSSHSTFCGSVQPLKHDHLDTTAAETKDDRPNYATDQQQPTHHGSSHNGTVTITGTVASPASHCSRDDLKSNRGPDKPKFAPPSQTAAETKGKSISLLESYMVDAEKAASSTSRIISDDRRKLHLPPSGRSVGSTGSHNKSVASSTSSPSNPKLRRGRRSLSRPRAKGQSEGTSESSRPSTRVEPSTPRDGGTATARHRSRSGKRDGGGGPQRSSRPRSCESSRPPTRVEPSTPREGGTATARHRSRSSGKRDGGGGPQRSSRPRSCDSRRLRGDSGSPPRPRRSRSDQRPDPPSAMTPAGERGRPERKSKAPSRGGVLESPSPRTGPLSDGAEAVRPVRSPSRTSRSRPGKGGGGKGDGKGGGREDANVAWSRSSPSSGHSPRPSSSSRPSQSPSPRRRIVSGLSGAKSPAAVSSGTSPCNADRASPREVPAVPTRPQATNKKPHNRAVAVAVVGTEMRAF